MKCAKGRPVLEASSVSTSYAPHHTPLAYRLPLIQKCKVGGGTLIKRADLVQTTAVSINPAPRRKRWGRKEWSQALLRTDRQDNNVLFTHAADARQEVCVLAKYVHLTQRMQ